MCWKVADSTPLSESSFNAKFNRVQNEYLEKKITAIALACISIFLTGFGLIWLGIGTMPSTMSFGFGVFPTLAGSQIVLLAAGTAVGALLFGVMTAIQAVRYCQLEKQRKAISRQSSMLQT